MSPAASALVAVAVTVAVLAGVYAAVTAWRSGTWIDGLTRSTVVVVVDEHTVRGVLVGVHRDCLVLTDAVLLGQPDLPLGGDVIVPRDKVLWLQDVPPTGNLDALAEAVT